MSKKSNVNDFLFGRRETGLLHTKYNLRSAAPSFRTISPNSSSSSDSFDDSFEQICKPLKKSTIPSSTDSKYATPRDGENVDDSMTVAASKSMCEKNKIVEKECDELDELFKNIALKDTTTTKDNIPEEWLDDDNDVHQLQNCDVGLSTVFEGSESKYRSSKSHCSSTISKDSGHSDISRDSLTNFVKPSETSKDSLDRSYVTSKSAVRIELNDTLEDVEYVCDEKNRYLLKPVSKRSTTTSTSFSMEYKSMDSSVIVIESSPDTSFVTAQNEIRTIDAKEIKTETLNDTLPSSDSSKDISLAPTVSSTNLSFTTAKNDAKLLNVDDIKSEFSGDKTTTSTTSDGKTNSWSTLDVSEETRTAPLIDERNDSLAIAESKSKSIDYDDIKSETSGDGQMFTCISYPKTASFFEDDDDNKTIDSDMGKSSEYFTAAAGTATNDESASSTSQPSVSATRYNTLDDIPSFSTDSTVSSHFHSNIRQNNSTDSSKQFNDSLERMEYMMQKGRELQQKSNTKTTTTEKPLASRAMNSPVSHYKMPTPKSSATTTSSSAQKRTFATPGTKTPVAKTKLFTTTAAATKKPVHPSPQAVTPVTRILKPFNRVQSAKTSQQSIDRKFTSPRASPATDNSPAFKKPNFPTPIMRKDPVQSRIPTSSNKKHFEHIVSPIGAYIKNIAAPPLLANVKPTSDFFDSSYCNKMSKELDYSVMSDGSGAGAAAAATKKPVSSLPVKFFTSSQQQRVIDEKFQKIPGGEKLNRIIGQMPSVISHQGRIHSETPVKRNVPIDDSFANMSVMSGDISVQVVRDVKRH